MINLLLGSAGVWYGKLLCAQCHTGTQPAASPRYDTSRRIIYCIIPLLHLITNNAGGMNITFSYQDFVLTEFILKGSNVLEPSSSSCPFTLINVTEIYNIPLFNFLRLKKSNVLSQSSPEFKKQMQNAFFFFFLLRLVEITVVPYNLFV